MHGNTFKRVLCNCSGASAKKKKAASRGGMLRTHAARCRMPFAFVACRLTTYSRDMYWAPRQFIGEAVVKLELLVTPSC